MGPHTNSHASPYQNHPTSPSESLRHGASNKHGQASPSFVFVSTYETAGSANARFEIRTFIMTWEAFSQGFLSGVGRYGGWLGWVLYDGTRDAGFDLVITFLWMKEVEMND